MRNEATLRKLGGSTVIAIPPFFWKSLGCSIGDKMDIRLENGGIFIRPKRPKLTLTERLDMYERALQHRTEADAEEDRNWDAAPVTGHELL